MEHCWSTGAPDDDDVDSDSADIIITYDVVSSCSSFSSFLWCFVLFPIFFKEKVYQTLKPIDLKFALFFGKR